MGGRLKGQGMGEGVRQMLAAQPRGAILPAGPPRTGPPEVVRSSGGYGWPCDQTVARMSTNRKTLMKFACESIRDRRLGGPSALAPFHKVVTFLIHADLALLSKDARHAYTL